MSKIKLITDSTVDLTKELIKELDLEVIPLVVSFDGDETTYYDGINIHQQDIIEKVKKNGKLPQTSCIGPGKYEEVFNDYIDKGYEIIFSGIGSKLSSAYQSVLIAKDSCKNPDLVTIIDSNNLSSATGLVLLKIRDFINQGLTRQEIEEKVNTEITPNIHASFCIDTTDYMVKGGRCSALTGFIVKIFSIKPIIVVSNGKLLVGKKPIGNINVAIKTIYTDMMKEIKDCDLEYMMVTHFCSDSAANYIIALLEETTGFKHIYNTNAGSVIGSHCGPGTIGLLYMVKPKKKKETVTKERKKK
ncbi:DegV family protein [bacterium]|nr:DegV family protein [bacterium]